MINYFLTHAASIGTVFFFIVFSYVLYYSLNKKNKKKFDESAQIPLKDDDFLKK